MPILIISFIGYLLGVWLIEFLSVRLHSIQFIKSVHTLVFVVISVLLAILLFEVIANRIFLSWITVGVFLAEGIVLLLNHGRCPLTAIAENLGDKHGQITDTLLPKWFADRVFKVYTWFFVAGFLGLAVRLII